MEGVEVTEEGVSLDAAAVVPDDAAATNRTVRVRVDSTVAAAPFAAIHSLSSFCGDDVRVAAAAS